MATTIDPRKIASWNGRTVYDGSGDKIGKLGQLWTDNQNGSPTWVTVHTGLFGLNETFLPAEGLQEAGEDLRTPFTKGQVKDAPNFDPSAGHLDPAEEERLYSHFGLHGQPRADETTRDTGTVSRDAGHDTSGPNTDDAMTRSEERLRVDTEQREAGRARLRKYVVTETEQVDVPVTREEVRLEREPITDANRGAALDGPDISEEEHVVTLHEERPVVDTEAVPVERVRLSKEQVTDSETVSGEVRKEKIETDLDAEGRRRS
jgi:uncharacterized protein (TIGR02271 family)